MEFVENEEVSVSCATGEQSKPFNVNRYSNDSGVDDVDLRPLEITEIHRLSTVGNGRSRPHSLHNSNAGMYCYTCMCYSCDCELIVAVQNIAEFGALESLTTVTRYYMLYDNLPNSCVKLC